VNLVGNPAVHFFKFFVLKRGHRMGLPGFFVACLLALHVFLKYAKLRERVGPRARRGGERD
jgi:hypothetical protein